MVLSRYVRFGDKYLVCIVEPVSTTTPVCIITNGMDSETTIPSSEITVSDKNAVVDDLRSSSPTSLESSEATLTIKYSPSELIPVKGVQLVSTENINKYTVTFKNNDGTVITKVVSVGINMLFLYDVLG